MSKIAFTVPGLPQPERKRQVPPRGSFHGARVDTPEAKDWKTWVRHCAAQVAPPTPLAGPLALTLTFYRPRPKSLPKRVKFPIARPDCTNCTKLAEDAMNGIIWIDDAQIVDQNVSKRFGFPPRLEVAVETLEDPPCDA